MDLVPTIDLAPFRLGGPSERAAVARALDVACCSVGFMQVVGHGIHPVTIAAMRRETESFFALPLDEKQLCVPSRPGLNRGYAALGSEALAYSLGVTPSRPDLFEAFNVGPDIVPDDDWHRVAPYDFFAPNIWPAEMPAFRSAVTGYFDAAARVAPGAPGVTRAS